MKNSAALILFFLLLCTSSCQIGRFVFYNFAGINDYKIFPERVLTKAPVPFTFHEASNTVSVPKKITYQDRSYDFDDFLSKEKTVGFLIIRNDTILYENYFRGKERSSIVPSFSMAKSFCSALIGCAIADGYIKSVNEPVTNYVPELKKNGFDSVTIKHVLQMTTGIKFNEGYFNPFGKVAAFYYGRKLRKKVLKIKTAYKAGTKFEYKSGNSQLLGLILDRALKTKTISAYLQEKIWTPLGMEYDASWSIDMKKNGLEKTFCCINARMRDYAKFGRLYLNKGKWNGQQIIPESWVNESTRIDETAGSKWYYQYQWWICSRTEGDYMAQGILGQFIYVYPKKNIVIVRLGKKNGDAYWPEVFRNLARSL
ncbi:MAG: serine hydrolase domain-containing protein [Bacteroidia bacterium]